MKPEDNEKNKDQLYLHGKYFDNEDDLCKYYSQWLNSQLDSESLNILLDRFNKEIHQNILLDRKITNSQMYGFFIGAILNIKNRMDLIDKS